MDLVTLLGIAVALAMDTVAVAVAAGISLPTVTLRHAFRLAWHFGLFQFLMPIIGWTAGLTVRPLIEQYDHWVAFGLLSCVGGKMIGEALSPHEHDRPSRDPSRGLSLVMLSVATSIDALGVGLSFAVLNISIWFPAVVIGLVTAGCTGAGLLIGTKVSSAPRISRYADISGGFVLIAIGVKILIAHGALRVL